MPWKTMDIQEQRVQFVVAANRREKSLTALCQEFDISRPTGMLWRARYQQAGLAGIAERSRRPRLSPDRTGAELEQRVVEVRQRYPDWGARKLQVVLARQNVLLTRSTVHRILLRHGLVHESDRHPQALQRFERSAPNELWQMDFKSPKGWNAPIGPRSVLDDHSRYLVVLQAVWSTRVDVVREQLECAFQQCGVPDGMWMDHGVPWWSTLAPGGVTKLTLWLMKQGIELHWSGIRHPQTQGKVERFHGELERALQKRHAPRKEPQPWLDAFRWEHNHVRPHEALDMQTPASRWQKSPRSYDPHPARWEYPTGSKVGKVDSWGKLHAWGVHCRVSKSFSGERVRLERIDRRVLVYYCRALIRELNLDNPRSTIVERGLSTSDSSIQL